MTTRDEAKSRKQYGAISASNANRAPAQSSLLARVSAPLVTLMLFISIGFMSDLNAKLAKGPADWISTSILVLSATLAFLQGGFLVKATGDLAASNRVLDDGLAKILIGSALVIVLGIGALDRMALPSMARAVYYPQYPPPPGIQPIDMYERATSLDPNFQGAYFRLGQAYEDSGDLAQAVSNYQTANRLNTVAADVQPLAPIVNWTWALARSGNFVAALQPLDDGFQRRRPWPERCAGIEGRAYRPGCACRKLSS
jgi:tetratricopeptide (TPR) repeat protein